MRNRRWTVWPRPGGLFSMAGSPNTTSAHSAHWHVTQILGTALPMPIDGVERTVCPLWTEAGVTGGFLV